MDFEMAYQAHVARERIRFAIKPTEQFAPRTEALREAELELLDALGAVRKGGSAIPTEIPIAGCGSFSNAEQTTPGGQRRRRRKFARMTPIRPRSIERDGKRCV